MLKIPIKNITAKILVIWQAGKKETAETFDADADYKKYKGEELYFGAGAFGSQRLSTHGQDWYSNCPQHLEFKVIIHYITGFVELQNC